MAQFDLRVNLDPRSSRRYPYLIELQADLLKDLPSRVVAPLRPLTPDRPPALSRLNPQVKVGGLPHIVVLQELSAVHASVLGPVVGRSDDRAALTGAWDLLFCGF